MKNTGNILAVLEPTAQGTKVSLFKPISFLISFLIIQPENERVIYCSDNLSGDEGNHTHVPYPRGDWKCMSVFEADTGSQKNPAFLNDHEIYLRGTCPENVTFFIVSCPFSFEKGFIKLLPLSYYSQDHSWMEGSSDSLAVSPRFQKCTFSPSALIRTENQTPQTSVLWINP